ncbi:MAG: hypothetical protein CME62_16690 [Halobacteriovoraceae bacterium]|nr:hypothetical protein [Halobacteriovoraceae bacterium]|tara:strand:- start:21507 stop:23045 length:1539 start_codon:yes stop_codon:yes gene_type:complete
MSVKFENLLFDKNQFLLTKKAIKLSGSDVTSFLNNQCTNELSGLAENSFHFNTLLDISGRLVSAFVLLKKSAELYYILLDDKNIETCLERIEKYHIAEDFEVEIIDQKFSLLINHEGQDNSFQGTYFYPTDQIIETENNTTDANSFLKLKTLTGVPEFGVEAHAGELINNTYFEELALNYNKGCFLGQETVAKIKTRRGAAFKPVLLETAKIEIKDFPQKISISNQKIGELRNGFTQGDKSYFYALVNRENRIDQKVLDVFLGEEAHSLNATVYYYPYLPVENNERATVFYDLAMEFFHQGDNELAISYFKKAIAIDPLFEDAYESLGVIYGRLEQYDKAIAAMEQLKNLNDKSMMAYTNLSLYHMKIGDIETAEKYKADATLLNFEKLGEEAKIKKEKQALEEKRIADIARRESMFKQVLEMDPVDPMANNGMGEILLDRKDYAGAIPYFEKAIEGNQKYSVAYLGLAKSLQQSGEVEKLKEVLEKGIAIASKNGDLMPANEMQRILTNQR